MGVKGELMIQRIHFQVLFLVTVIVFMIGIVFAADKLPPGFAALVPQGYEISSAQCTKSGNLAGVSFVARKHFEGRHSVFNSEYHLDLNIREVPAALVKMQGPIYQSQLAKDIEGKRQSYASHQSGPAIQYDPPVETKYAWGWGITRRNAHHFIGAGKAPDEIEYTGDYLGLIMDDHSIKKFELSVSGVESRTEVDQWAKKVVEKVEKTTLSNIQQ
jgi:hypothetical protein